ncbi:OmpA family protein [Reichenbachiella sp. MALMAid0571]|uniref:OmpA family protein n=1 Tax=Reichenbachiella sp. MALMAid0571 TaxID=3143939 RepID=UPI0032DE3666
MNKALILIFVVVLGSCSSMKKAEKSFLNGEYNSAILMYQKSLKPNDPVSNFKLAEAYRKSNRLHEAEPFYRASLNAGIDDESANYYYASSLKANQKYDEAKKVLEDYLNKGQEEEVVALAQKELSNIEGLTTVKEKVNYFRVKNLEEINTPSAEYSPVYNNGFLYFTSNRDGGKIYKTTGTPFTDIYKIKTKGAKVDLNTLTPLPEIINDPNINEGSIAISQDGSSVIYAKGNNGKYSGTNEVDLYFTRVRNGRWTKPRIINASRRDSWDSSPALSSDGKTLYFASNREGGFGGIDLYTAKLNRRGRWVDVRNLGDKINTPGNEVFPFIAEDGQLYFSSDGHPGMGGADIFISRRENGEIIVENAGEPINSPKDDFGIYLFNETRGFFTSNRDGGKGDDDIYTFVNDDPNLKIVNYFLSGTTQTPDLETGELKPLANTKVYLLDEDGQIIDEDYTQVDGKYNFRVYSEENYDLLAEKENYFTTRKPFSTVGKSVDRTKLENTVTNVNFTMDLPLDQIIIEKPILVENIYYDLDKSDIRPDAALELDKLVVMMKDNPEITIELSSHTDARADDNYNMSLSQRRAKSAVDYIVSKGVDYNRLIPKGYGETHLKIKEAQTEEEHQINRRTEFKVTKYKKKKQEKEEVLLEEGQVTTEVIQEEDDDTDRYFTDEDEN